MRGRPVCPVEGQTRPGPPARLHPPTLAGGSSDAGTDARGAGPSRWTTTPGWSSVSKDRPFVAANRDRPGGREARPRYPASPHWTCREWERTRWGQGERLVDRGSVRDASCRRPCPSVVGTGETNPTPRPDATLDGPLRPACLSDRALSYITWRGAHAGARPRSRTYARPGTSASAHRQTWGIRVAILARRAIT